MVYIDNTHCLVAGVGWMGELVGEWKDGLTVYYFSQYQMPCFKLESCESKVSSF